MIKSKHFVHNCDDSALLEALDLILDFFKIDKTKYFINDLSINLNQFVFCNYKNDSEMIKVNYLSKNHDNYTHLLTKIIVQEQINDISTSDIEKIKKYINSINFKTKQSENRIERFETFFKEADVTIGQPLNINDSDDIPFDYDLLEYSYLNVSKTILVDIEKTLSHDFLSLLFLKIGFDEFCRKKYNVKPTYEDFLFLYPFCKNDIFFYVDLKYGEMNACFEYTEHFLTGSQFNFQFDKHGLLTENFKDYLVLNFKV